MQSVIHVMLTIRGIPSMRSKRLAYHLSVGHVIDGNGQIVGFR